jgi:DnaJ-class molecular chaperone
MRHLLFNPALIVVVLGFLAYQGWRLSSMLHPYTRCGACKGRGRHRGAVFSYAWRPCHVCGGSGRKQRRGAVMFKRGQRSRSTKRIQPRTPG